MIKGKLWELQERVAERAIWLNISSILKNLCRGKPASISGAIPVQRLSRGHASQ